MKKILTMMFSLVIALLIIIFTDIAESEAATVQKNFKKLANQLYEVTYDDYQSYYDFTNLYNKGYSNLTAGACSTIRVGNYLGHNFDFIAGDAAEIVVRTTSKENRYATVGMFGAMLWLNSEMMDSGIKDEDIKEFIAHFILDGINEKGVAMESNVVCTLDAGGRTLHTNPGKKEVSKYLLERVGKG